MILPSSMSKTQLIDQNLGVRQTGCQQSSQSYRNTGEAHGGANPLYLITKVEFTSRQFYDRAVGRGGKRPIRIEFNTSAEYAGLIALLMQTRRGREQSGNMVEEEPIKRIP